MQHKSFRFQSNSYKLQKQSEQKHTQNTMQNHTPPHTGNRNSQNKKMRTEKRDEQKLIIKLCTLKTIITTHKPQPISAIRDTMPYGKPNRNLESRKKTQENLENLETLLNQKQNFPLVEWKMKVESKTTE